MKYINLRDVPSRLHEPRDFEFASALISHSSFEELHRKVFGACPRGYKCVEPIALRHEVLWSLGLKALRGDRGDWVWERDELVHAVEEGEYNELWVKTDKTLSLCVDVVEDRAILSLAV